MEGLYLFDKNKELVDVISPESIFGSEQTVILNGLITHIVNGKYSKDMKSIQFFGVQDIDDDNNFWLYRISNKTKTDGQFELVGTHVLFDDLKGRGGIMRDRRPRGVGITNILPDILNGTGWQIGRLTSNNQGTSNYYYVSKLDAFWDFLEKWNVEYYPRMTYSNGQITGKYIDIHNRLSDDHGKWYEKGDRLLTVLKEEDSSSIYTAFIGRGKGEEVGDGFGRRITFEDVEWSIANGDPIDKPLGQDYLEIPWATDAYGYEDDSPRMGIIEFTDIEDKAELLQATYEYAVEASRPRIHMEADVSEQELIEVGEVVTIISDDENIRYKTRVFKLVRDFKHKQIKKVELGDKLITTQGERVAAVVKDAKKTEIENLDLLDAIRKQIIDSYFNEDGYNYELQAGNEYGLPGGYYSFNAPIDQNPDKVVYMGAGQLLIANSKLPDGSWDWRTAMNGDGIVADQITTGRLRAELIQAGFNEITPTVEMTGDGLVVRSVTGERSMELRDAGLIMSSDNLETGRLYGIDSASRGKGIALTTYDDRFMGFYIDDGSGLKSVMYIDGHTRALNMDDNQILNVGRIGFGNPLRSQIYKSESDNFYVRTDNELTLRGDRGIDISGQNFEMYEDTSGGFVIDSEGNLGLNANEVVLYSNLNMNSYTITNESDIRLKKNIEDSNINALNQIERLEFIEYEWDKDKRPHAPDGKQFGIKAQYAPFLQTKSADEDSYLSIDMNKHVNFNSKAIQELHEENKQLRKELDEIKQLLKGD